jgi:1-acyl-sn-glycerol-3-phosphate acyltransferase
MIRLLQSIYYWANIAWMRLLLFFDTSREVKGKENVPRTGPLILVSNHLNNADPPIISSVTPRQISFLTKQEWFKTPIVGTMFKMGGMIPVRRFAADLHALREAQKLLQDGGCLGMFPEGTRSRDGVMHQGEPGTALVALRTGAPIQPVAIWGTESVKLPKDMLLKRTKVHVRYGKPFTLPRPQRISREDVDHGTETIMKTIAALLPEKYRGFYAGDDRPARKVGTGTD